MMTSRRAVEDYLYDSTEHTATCCLGDVFFRKRRLTSASDYYGSGLKAKLPVDDDVNDNDDTSGRLASSTERTVAAAGAGVNLNSKYQGSSDDNSRGTRLVDNDSYNRAVSHPVSGLGGAASRQGSLQDSNDLPPRYTPTREPAPVQTTSTDVARGRTGHRPRAVSAGRLAKEHEMLQNMWLDNHGRRQQGERQQRLSRRTSSVGSRTVYVTDRPAGTTYRRGRLLGKGGFARCYEMTDTSTDAVYAGKVLSKARITKPRQREKIMREVELHRSLDHTHIVKFHSYFEDEHNIYFILEYCSRKSLVDILKTRTTLTEPEVRFFMSHLIQGCQYIHGRHVIHRDLKLGNMLINDAMQVKIADFGLATRIEYRGEKKMTVCGTPNYIAPEIIQRRGHSYEADIWSLGCITYAMLCGRPPFETSTLKETYERIAANRYTIPNHVTPAARDLIGRLLSHYPQNRPSLSAILRHEFFTCGYMPTSLNVNCCYTAPKFPAFDAPRPRSYAGPATAVHEAQLVNQHLRRSSSQRVTRSKPTTAGPVSKAELNSERSSFTNQNELNDQRSSITNEKAALCTEIQRTDSAGRMYSAIRLYKTLSSCLDVMPPDSVPTPVQNCQQLWVTKWVDYSNKYGFGYQLSDGTVGILYNDMTRMLLHTDGRSLQYNDLSNRVIGLTKDDVPADLKKKVTLLIYFSQYMDEHLIYGADVDASKRQSTFNCGPSLVSAGGVFMKKWFRTDRAIVMHLSNGTLQVNFFDDHTKMIVSAEAQDYLVTYIDSKRHSVSYQLLQLRHFGCSVHVVDRLRYARHVLQTVINIAGEPV